MDWKTRVTKKNTVNNANVQNLEQISYRVINSTEIKALKHHEQ